MEEIILSHPKEKTSATEEQQKNLPLFGKKILAVDDSPTCLKLLEIILDSSGIKFHSENNGLDGFRSYEQNQPDLIILDMVMPRMSGLEVLNKIRESDKKTPIIIVTASIPVGPHEEDEFKKAGANFVMIKPINNAQLIKVMNKLVELEEKN